MVSARFTPWRVRTHQVCPHINSSNDQVFQIYLSHTEKKRQYCAHDETEHVNFSFFNPLKVTDEREITSLGNQVYRPQEKKLHFIKSKLH